jgi:flagellar hook-associated protein 2
MSSAISSTGTSTATTPSTTATSGTGTSTAPTAQAAASSTITSQGIGSGLDISSIVSSLTSSFGASQQNQITNQENTLDAQVSAYGQFTSALDTLKTATSALSIPSNLEGFTASVADKTVASATTNDDAVAGQYSLLVNNLATAAQLTSAPLSSTAGIGTGQLTLSVGGKSTSVNIDTTDNTLSGIAAAINSAPNNPGVTANIINTTAGARLVISGTATGATNGITVTQSGGDGGLAAIAYDPAGATNGLTQTTAASDASFSINGFPATSASNQVTTAITGVTINLVGASADATTPTTLTVSPDSTAAQTAIGNFTDALNGVLSTIQSLTSYDPTSGVAGPLNGNATLEAFQNQLQTILGKVVQGGTGGIKSLSDLGITADPDGSYDTDPTKLGNALTGNLSSVINLLSGTNGLVTQVDALVNNYTKTGGLIDNINQGLTTGLKSLSDQQTALNAQLATYSATLTAQYNAMDTAVAKLKQMQTYLTAEFNQGSTSSSSSSSSLGSGNVGIN